MTCADYSPAAAQHRKDVEDAILLAMEEHPGWWASHKLAIHIKIDHATTAVALQRLKRRKMVECEVQLWRGRR